MTTWTTREVAVKVGITEHTLRWYERIGLLDRIERGADGRRRFGERDIEWILLLVRLRSTGMSVRDMQRYAVLVRSGAGEAERLALLEEHRRVVRAALVAQQECLDLLDNKIRSYRRATRAADEEQ
ncbi:MerR family transcriptional regulator [Frankia sp. AgKG'84/4]|uniref:MerR family transcriptional regulator n=1 Tax=Frankia sp. AgKG'84/4 TaxID=573490 RepID=UPI00200BFE47|nr:MerR family transcriptional regulator [Frankia sp. AgKG'84/4]MCL9792792.1 MerR family transcriptional regulator [Frankia sp. AgKG'84/4]